MKRIEYDEEAHKAEIPAHFEPVVESWTPQDVKNGAWLSVESSFARQRIAVQMNGCDLIIREAIRVDGVWVVDLSVDPLCGLEGHETCNLMSHVLFGAGER